MTPAQKRAKQKYRASPKYKATQDRYNQRRYRTEIRTLYGVTPTEYDELFVAQGGHCALCLRTNRLCIDHDHITGRVRGLLCTQHNSGLGMIGDDEESVQRLLKYVRGTP